MENFDKRSKRGSDRLPAQARSGFCLDLDDTTIRTDLPIQAKVCATRQITEP